MKGVALLILIAVVLSAPGCGDDAAWRVTDPLVPADVALTAEKDMTAVGLGGTLVGGRLFYGRTREQGREAAWRDIARGRPQWIGSGFVAWHHSGVNPHNGLPGVCGWNGWGTGKFFEGYNAEMEVALKRGAIRPPVQVNEGSNFFALINLLAQGAVWPELKEGQTPLGSVADAALRLVAHSDDDSYAYVSIVRSGADPIRFALVTRPVRLHLPESGHEIVMREVDTIRVFHRATGALLREFPHSERDVDEIRKLHEERAKKEGGPK